MPATAGNVRKIRHEVADVAEAHLGVARIGKCRIIVRSCPATRRSTAHWRGQRSATSRFRRPGPSKYWERESPVGRCQRQSAAKPQTVGLPGRSMARRAVAGREDELSLGRIALSVERGPGVAWKRRSWSGNEPGSDCTTDKASGNDGRHQGGSAHGQHLMREETVEQCNLCPRVPKASAPRR